MSVQLISRWSALFLASHICARSVHQIPDKKSLIHHGGTQVWHGLLGGGSSDKHGGSWVFCWMMLCSIHHTKSIMCIHTHTHTLLHKPFFGSQRGSGVTKRSGHVFLSLLNGVDREPITAPSFLQLHTPLEPLACQSRQFPHSPRRTEQKGEQEGACLRPWDQDALHWWWEKGEHKKWKKNFWGVLRFTFTFFKESQYSLEQIMALIL